jgi:hypothetical protein
MPEPGITERVDSHSLATFGVEGEARLLHNSPIGGGSRRWAIEAESAQ